MTYQLCVLKRGENEREHLYIPYYLAQVGNVIDWCEYDIGHPPAEEDWDSEWLIKDVDSKLFNMMSMRPSKYFRIHNTNEVFAC